MQTQNLGYPRIGGQIQLKEASGQYWTGKIDLADLQKTAFYIREENWQTQLQAGVDLIPCGLLTKAAALLPARYLWMNPDCGLKTRKWSETKAAFENMVAAACEAREKISVASMF